MKSSAIPKKYIVFLLLLLAVASVIIGLFQNKSIRAEDITQIERITNDNKHLIGKEGYGNNPSESKLETKAEENIPNNSICFSVANKQISPGATIQEIEITQGTTPEIIIPNGAMGIFSQGDSLGWDCKTGDILSWKFEKYPMENLLNQSLGIGYIKDGVMYEMQVYTNSLDGEYRLNISSDGIYYIYFICLSSDPISLKEGDILQKIEAKI